jgi:hypothetical protein
MEYAPNADFKVTAEVREGKLAIILTYDLASLLNNLKAKTDATPSPYDNLAVAALEFLVKAAEVK